MITNYITAPYRCSCVLNTHLHENPLFTNLHSIQHSIEHTYGSEYSHDDDFFHLRANERETEKKSAPDG
jgi:hypothetical protein